jgi:hypothetical protein
MASLPDVTFQGGKPVHFDTLAGAVPGWLIQAGPARHRAWQAALDASLVSSSAAEALLARVIEPAAFVAPRLNAALRARFNRDIEVDSAELWRFRRQAELDPDIPLRYVGEGQTARIKVSIARQTLVQAAMANFDAAETSAQAFEADSALVASGSVTDADEYGQGPWYDPRRTLGIAPHEFAETCRALDLGQAYQAHLRGLLDTPEASHLLQANARDDVRLQAEGARLRQAISDDAHAMLLGLLDPDAGPASWSGHPVQVCRLHLLRSLNRHGIPVRRGVLLQQVGGPQRCVLYLPGEPSQPICEYASLAECEVDLRERLRRPRYLAYFSGLVGLADRADFLLRLRNALRPLPFWSLNPTDAQRQDDPDADLTLRAASQPHGLVACLQRQQLTQWLADARTLVVPNEDEDRKAREARLTSWASVGLDLANLASFFVPGVGVVLLGFTATQLLGDAVIGLDQWRHGERVEALRHFQDIAQTLAIAALGAGVAQVIRRSPLVEGLLPVVDAQGRARLLKAGLDTFASSDPLPPDVVANASGQYRVGAIDYIRLDGRLYRQRYDTALRRWLIEHPDPAVGYRLPLAHNRQGAWRAHHEDVRGWTDAQLLRRLGPRVEGLDDLALERLRRTARLSSTGLRDLHRHGLPMPAAFAEAIERAQRGLARQAQRVIADSGAEGSAGAGVILRDFPGLPPRIAEEIAQAARFPERQSLGRARLPLRLAEQARLALRDWRLAAALDGLWCPAVDATDSERLLQGLQARLPLPLPVEATALRLAVYDYAIEHRDQAASVLGQHRAQPWWRPPVRAANGLVGYALSGRGAAPSPAPPVTIEQRLRALYPNVHEPHLQHLLGELGEDPERALDSREAEYAALGETLQRWVEQPSQWTDEHGQSHPVDASDRDSVAMEIRAAWRRESGLISVDSHPAPFSDLNLSERHVGTLPTLAANFDHVRSLSLADMGLSDDPSAFLARFARVDSLELQENTLTAIPAAIAEMPELRGLSIDSNRLEARADMFEPLRNATHLTYLVLGGQPLAPPLEALQWLGRLTRLRELGMPDMNLRFDLAHWRALEALPELERLWLGHNQLELTAEIVEVLAGMHSLHLLDLHANPLGQAPNVGQLNLLQMLDLRSCGLTRLPLGLEGLMGLANGRLRSVWLHDNPIGELPPLAHLAFFRRPLRTFSLSREHLDAVSAQRLAMALRVHPLPAGFWPRVEEAGPTDPDWLQGAAPALLEQVAALREEPEARHFLEALDRAEDMAAYRRDPVTGRQRAQRLVQALLEPGPGEDGQGLSHLRQAFFAIGEEVMTTCGDGIQLLLSRCETLLQVHRSASAASSLQAPLQPLLRLARQMLRAELVDEAAMRVVRGREARRALRESRPTEADAALSELDEPALAQQPLATDEVEVRLRFRLDLATRLDLPPQAERMLYQLDTSPAQLDRVAAYVSGEMSDARLANWLLDQSWWCQLLERRDPQALFRARQPWRDGQEYLYELGSPDGSLPVLAPAVVARLNELLPGRAWLRDGVSQRVTLDDDEQELARQGLSSGQRQAQEGVLRGLTEAAISAGQ